MEPALAWPARGHWEPGGLALRASPKSGLPLTPGAHRCGSHSSAVPGTGPEPGASLGQPRGQSASLGTLTKPQTPADKDPALKDSQLWGISAAVCR